MTPAYCIDVVSSFSDVMSDLLHVQFSNTSSPHAPEEAHSFLVGHLLCEFRWLSDYLHGEGNAIL